MSKNIKKVAEKIVLKGPPNLDFILKRSLERKKKMNFVMAKYRR